MKHSATRRHTQHIVYGLSTHPHTSCAAHAWANVAQQAPQLSYSILVTATHHVLHVRRLPQLKEVELDMNGPPLARGKPMGMLLSSFCMQLTSLRELTLEATDSWTGAPAAWAELAELTQLTQLELISRKPVRALLCCALLAGARLNACQSITHQNKKPGQTV